MCFWFPNSKPLCQEVPLVKGDLGWQKSSRISLRFPSMSNTLGGLIPYHKINTMIPFYQNYFNYFSKIMKFKIILNKRNSWILSPMRKLYWTVCSSKVQQVNYRETFLTKKSPTELTMREYSLTTHNIKRVLQHF